MFHERRRVILYGDSLILAGIQARLGHSVSLEVIALERPLPDLASRINDLRPAAVIFDLGGDQSDFPLYLLRQPNLLLIGIDPEADQMLVWSGQTAAAAAAEDLMDLIQQRSTT